MAGTNKTWNDSFELIPVNGSAPKTHPQEVQDFKVTTRSKLAKEHDYDNETADVLSCEHSQGSAKAFVKTIATEGATTRPDGTAMDSYDAGRLLTTTDDNALKVYKDTTDKFVHLFEDDDVAPLDPTGTLASLQDKIDALAYQVKAVMRQATWNEAPTVTSVHKNNPTEDEIFTIFDSKIPTVGDKIPVHGALSHTGSYPVTTCADIEVYSYASRTSSTQVTMYYTTLNTMGTGGGCIAPRVGTRTITDGAGAIGTSWYMSIALGV